MLNIQIVLDIRRIMKFKPLYDQILIVQEKKETETESGLILPDTAKQLLIRAKVVSVGTGARLTGGERYPIDCKEGDTVLVNTRAGIPWVIEGREYRIVRDYEIIGVIEDD